MLKPMIIAFAMYSAIPMPRVEWSKENMRTVLCFFPLIGGVTAGLLLLWAWLCQGLGLGEALRAAGMTLLPVAVTGGIHLDGFCDTVDALASHQDRERKLEILKDPHVGAFAVMGVGCYLLLTFALWQELEPTPGALGVLGLGFLLSRAISGWGVARLRCAKESGLAAAFAGAADKNRVARGTALLGVAALAGMCVIDPKLGLWAGAAALGTLGYYRVMAYRQFGGITGDLAGYFLQLCEIAMLAAAVLGQKLG